MMHGQKNIRLMVFERNVLRKIVGPTNENGI